MSSALDFLPVELSFPNHPKTLKVARVAGWAAAGHIVILWLWVASNRPDGDLAELTADDLEAAAKWSGPRGTFSDALKNAQLLDGEFPHTKVHNWRRRQAYFAQMLDRKKEALRKRRYRSRDMSHGSVGHVPSENGTSLKRRGDKRRSEDQDHPPAPQGGPHSRAARARRSRAADRGKVGAHDPDQVTAAWNHAMEVRFDGTPKARDQAEQRAVDAIGGWKALADLADERSVIGTMRRFREAFTAHAEVAAEGHR